MAWPTDSQGARKEGGFSPGREQSLRGCKKGSRGAGDRKHHLLGHRICWTWPEGGEMSPDISCGQKTKVREHEERVGKEKELRRSQDRGREGNGNGRNTLIDFNLKQGRGKQHRKRGSKGNEQETEEDSGLGVPAKRCSQRLIKTFEKEMINVDVRSQVNTALF